MTGRQSLITEDGLEQLKQYAPMVLVNTHFAGADLSGQKISDCSLLGANFSGANLRGAHLQRVDLRLANLQGACLESVTLEMVNASGAVLRGAQARHIRMHHVNLFEADLEGANLSRAMLNTCTLEKANLDGCDLTSSYLVYSACARTSFRRAQLEGLTALGSTFSEANFNSAIGFFRCNEIVAEVLLREAGGDLQRIMECAAIVVDRERCYAEWKDYLVQHADAEAFALQVFSRYPESGCAEALLNV